jgi:predicted RNA-binding protein with PIN domain
MIRDLLIDGYNLMHAAGYVRRTYGPGDLERCRLRLLNLVAGHLDEAQRLRTTVVFDAKDPPPDAARWSTYKEMHVEFAPPGKEADDVIEELIARNSTPKRLLVVSSDHRLHKAARRRKAKVRDSEQFLDACEAAARSAPPTEAAPAERPQAKLSPEEVAAWSAEFGDVDVAQLRAEIRRPAEQSPPAATAPGAAPPAESTPVLDADEVEFWRRRVAELLDQAPRGKSGKR